MNEDREHQIRARAYRRWEEEGRPTGRDRQHWQDAERELAGEDTASGSQGISNHPPDDEAEQQQHLPPAGTKRQTKSASAARHS